MTNGFEIVPLTRVEKAYRKAPTPELRAIRTKAYQTEFLTLQEAELIELTERGLYNGLQRYSAASHSGVLRRN